MPKKVLRIVIASTRPNRVGGYVGDWVRERAVDDDRFDVQVTDLRELNLPFLDEPEEPSDGGYVKQHTIDWSATVSGSDAFIFVIPEYNHSFTAPWKNAIDFLYSEWHFKPGAFVSYGGVAAGTRAVQAARLVLVAVKMLPVLNNVPIPHVRKKIEDGKFVPTEQMEKSLTGILNEIERVLPGLEAVR